MKKTLLLVMAAMGGCMFANDAKAQETVIAEEGITTYTVDNVACKDNYYSTWRDNWFIQLGTGVNLPIVENELASGDAKAHFTMAYNVGFGKWFSPYIGWRMSMYGGVMHWDNVSFSKANMVNANLDFMWDMFNSLGGVNSSRVFSIVPYVGLGGTYTWGYEGDGRNIVRKGETLRSTAWTLPVSAGLQLRFRLCKYVNFFLEGRASFYGDNFNLCAYDKPLDIDITAVGGFQFKIGGDSFRTYNPCNDVAYIESLNGQINALRGDLAATATALAVAESQLPCPQAPTVVESETTIVGPMMSTVRFTINSAKISPEEMVNVYNVAQYLKENPGVNVAIVGYADKDTGTANYNMDLSKRRAQAVYDALTKTYGIDGSRLTMQAEGSAVQPYDTNNWNRIVIFIPQN